jgi:predicted membrane chloride channel (bestrophin family)
VAQWPKTVSGNLFTLLLLAVAAIAVVQLAVALSGPFVWGSLAVIAVTCAGVVVWRRRVLAAHDRTVADAWSFGDVVERVRAREAV